MATTPTKIVINSARLARAISHPVRLQILDELRDEGAYVMHLTAVLGRPQANISQHLMVLRQAGLVTAIRDGMTVLYQLGDVQVLEVLDALFSLTEKQCGRHKLAAGDGEITDNDHLGGRRRRRGDCRCPRCSKAGA